MPARPRRRSTIRGANSSDVLAVANDIIAYIEMCRREGTSLQQGMNFGLGGNHSVILMSLRRNAPYGSASKTVAQH